MRRSGKNKADAAEDKIKTLAEVQRETAQCYMDGIGVGKNIVKAATLYQAAAKMMIRKHNLNMQTVAIMAWERNRASVPRHIGIRKRPTRVMPAQ